MKNIQFKFYTVILFLCSSFSLFAQIGINDTDGTLENEDAAAVTIDEFLWILMLAGLLFAMIKSSKTAMQQKKWKLRT